MVYTKPELYVENFVPNVAVASSCQRDFSGTAETKYDKQDITCLRLGSTTDYLFTEGVTGCDYQPNAIGWLDGPKTDTIPNDYKEYKLWDVSQQLSYTINGINANSRDTVQVKDDDGSYFVIWGNGNHYGFATAEIVDIMINSY